MSDPNRRSRFSVARVHPLGREPTDDLVRRTTPAERLAMVWPLTLEAWSLARRSLPDYEREETPVRVVDRHPGRRSGEPT